MTARTHTEFVEAFYRISWDRANKIAILTGAGGARVRQVVKGTPCRRLGESGRRGANGTYRSSDQARTQGRPGEKYDDVFEETIEGQSAVWGFGGASEKRRSRARASSGRAFSGTTNGSGNVTISGFNIPTPNLTVAQTSSAPSSSDPEHDVGEDAERTECLEYRGPAGEPWGK